MNPSPGARRRPTSPLLVVLFLLAAGPAGAEGWASLSLPNGDQLSAEVMQTTEERRRGLMGRDTLPDDRLMLFRYDADGVHRVWMKDCKFPIDVAWLDADGNVVSVAEALPPCPRDPCPIYGHEIDSRYFVEGNAGWLKARGVAVGERIAVGATGQRP